jgi:CDP-glycerol glycerophosphotransferase
MAFSFRRANTRRLLFLPLSAVLFLFSMLTPRRKNRWVFGRKGMFGGNSRYLLDYVRAHHPEIEAIWLAHSEAELAEARANGARAELAGSRRGWAAALTAEVGIVSLGLGDLNRNATGGMFVVQLWHGLPLKKLGLDSPVSFVVWKGPFSKPAERLVRAFYRLIQSRYKLVTAPSEMVRLRYESAFGLRPGRVALTGEPKTDVILGPKDEGPCAYWQAEMKRVFAIPEDARIILYAPTWREEQDVSLVPDEDVLDDLERLLADTNAVLLLRGHHFSDSDKNGAAHIRGHISIMPPSQFPDVNYLLSAIDVMISDYSGIMIDFSLLDRPILFLAPDLDYYASTRGLYESYELFTGGAWATGWADLLNDLRRCLGDGRANYVENARRMSSRYNGRIDLENRARVYRTIIDRVSHRAT